MSAVLDMPELPFAATLEDAFMRFHAQNPQVYDFLTARVREWKEGGHDHGSIRMFWELARYEFCKTVKRDSKFKLNNNHHAFYSRLIMQREADLAGFFETRDHAETSCE